MRTEIILKIKNIFKQKTDLDIFIKKARQYFLERYQALILMLTNNKMTLEDAEFFLKNEPSITNVIKQQKEISDKNMLLNKFNEIVASGNFYAEDFLSVAENNLLCINEQIKLVEKQSALTPAQIVRKNKSLEELRQLQKQTEITISDLKQTVEKFKRPVGRPRKNDKPIIKNKGKKGRPPKQNTNEENQLNDNAEETEN